MTLAHARIMIKEKHKASIAAEKDAELSFSMKRSLLKFNRWMRDVQLTLISAKAK